MGKKEIEFEAGKAYKINHSRKGIFSLSVRSVSKGGFVYGKLLDEVVEGRSTTWLKGDEIGSKISFCKIIKEIKNGGK